MTDINALKNESKLDQKINTNQDEDLLIYGYKKSLTKQWLTYVSFVLTLGLLRLVYHWYPRLLLFSTHRRCPLERATKLLIIDDYQGSYKSFFVKDVKVISSADLSIEPNRSFLYNDEKLIQEVKGKSLPISLENGTRAEVSTYRAFWCKKQCYIWDIKKREFSRLVGLDQNTLCFDLNREKNKGLSKKEQCLRRIVYGFNEISVPIQGIGILLVMEILNPYYVFQVFTLVVWLIENYYYYTGAIICMSIYGITSSIIQTRKNQINLHNTVAMTETVHVLRENGDFDNISSAHLVPGDIIELPKYGGIIVCDAVLLSGTCIVNESMLTGESVPVTKTPLRPLHNYYDDKECCHHTLYSGTTIIQTRQLGDKPILARVIRTGLQTKKGSLVAAILYPPPIDYKFDRDSYKYMGILGVIALGGFIYTVVSKISRGITASDVAVKALDIITIVIPPALPTVLTVGKLYAQARLKHEQIYCINNKIISVAGSVNCVCFDKTGTLTEEGLDLWGVVPCTNNEFEPAEQNITQLERHPIFEGMLVCHSLTMIDGKYIGDPLDVKMFESTGWVLEEPRHEDLNENETVHVIIRPSKVDSSTETLNTMPTIGILQQFQFSSQLQRMSVVVKSSTQEELMVYTKGSPEMIMVLSKPETIPANIISTLHQYTEKGYRVIAIGRTNICNQDEDKLHKLKREAVEKDLEFLGLVVLENRLKPTTISVIKELREAQLNVIMITGDNIQTAVSVAKECGILASDETVIDVNVILEMHNEKPKIYFNAQSRPNYLEKHSTLDLVEKNLGTRKFKFVVSGHTWHLLRQHYSDLLTRICVRGAVFARMSSDQKKQLVVELMQLGYYVAMCGDGANDCGALRAAHVGISLSEAESSVASPFTSRINDITCVPTIIEEGRAALVTSFGIFKFMVTYSLTEFISTTILYTIDSNCTDLEYLFIDICLIMNLASVFGKTEAYKNKLHKKPPMTALLGFSPLYSLSSNVMLMAIFQAAAFHYVQYNSWFTPFVMKSTTSYESFENYSVFCVSMFQYIIVAIIYSRGKPYRKPIYTNVIFLASIVITTLVCVYITLIPSKWIQNALQLMVPPVYNWRLVILLMAFCNLLVCWFNESFIVEFLIEKMRPKYCKPKTFSKEYLNVEKELMSNPEWPCLTSDSLHSVKPSSSQNSFQLEMDNLNANSNSKAYVNFGFTNDNKNFYDTSL